MKLYCNVTSERGKTLGKGAQQFLKVSFQDEKGLTVASLMFSEDDFTGHALTLEGVDKSVRLYQFRKAKIET